MFELILTKNRLLTPLLTLAGAVDRKQHLSSILSHILLEASAECLRLTATDLEIEMSAHLNGPMPVAEQQSVTLPAKKFIDILRSLDEDAELRLTWQEGVFQVQAGRSRFKLATLPAQDFPKASIQATELELRFPRPAFIHLLSSTHFAMSQQDIRVFLNGLLLEFEGDKITTVAADGHRLAICQLPYAGQRSDPQRFLVPRKGIVEALKILNHITDEEIDLSIGKDHFKLSTLEYTFQSKLIEARFPLYRKVIPLHQDKWVILDKDLLKRALMRTAILAHEKSRTMILQIQKNSLTLVANNQEQEEAMELIEAETAGEALTIAINAGYLLDVLNYIRPGQVKLSFSTPESSVLIESLADPFYQYVIMPMKL